MTADGKIAPQDRHYVPFSSRRDRRQMMALRATADAVMSGARTVDLYPLNLGPGSAKNRRKRIEAGLSEYNLRIIVSGAGTVSPKAEIFKHRFSPIIVLASARISEPRWRGLQAVADEVKIFGEAELDFRAALRWLRQKWGVKRLLCEGGGELNEALFRHNLVNEVHLTICPLLLGGRQAPTLADGRGHSNLSEGCRLDLQSKKRFGDELFLVYSAPARAESREPSQ